jgi:signal transduction histidine kinase
MQYRLRRQDGEYRWILDYGVPRFDQDGFFAGYIGSCIDVTDQKLAEDAVSTIGQQLIQAQEEERTRIARELHDDINQRVAVIALNLKQVENDLSDGKAKLRERVASECKQLSELATDIQALSHRLHSSKLEYLGFEAAARGFCAEMAKLENVKIDFHAERVPQALSKETSLSLFRVLQEALRNGVKHSGSKKFQVVINCLSDEVELKVRDWGIGFVPKAATKGWGLGLTSMRERLKLVGGTLSIESQPGAGTTIYARAPLYTATKSPMFRAMGRVS